MVGLQGIASGSNFLLVVLLSRIYGLEIFGIYSMVWLVLIFAMSIQQSMVLSPLMTFWAKNENHTVWSRFFSWNIMVSFMLSLFSALFAYYAHNFASKWVIEKFGFVIFFLIFFFLSHTFNRRSLINMGALSFAFLMDVIAYLPVLFIIPFFTPSLMFIFIVQTVSTGMAVIISWIKLKPQFFFTGQITGLFKEIWNFSSWLLFTGLLQWFAGNYFIVAAGTILGASALGIIRLGQSASGVFNVFFLALENRVPFSASKLLKHKGKSALTQYLKDIFIKGGVFTIVSVLLFIVFSKEIVWLLYGKKFLQYYWVLAFFAALQLFVFTNTLFQITLRAAEKTKFIFLSYLLISGFTILAAFPVVKTWGLEGALAGLCSAQILNIVFNTLFLKKIWKKI